MINSKKKLRVVNGSKIDPLNIEELIKDWIDTL